MREKDFKNYRRKSISEMRPVDNIDLYIFSKRNMLIVHETKDNVIEILISDVDRQNGSPKIGDMIARNPKNHLDQWLVAKQYFEDNLEPI